MSRSIVTDEPAHRSAGLPCGDGALRGVFRAMLDTLLPPPTVTDAVVARGGLMPPRVRVQCAAARVTD